MQHRLI